LKDIDRIADKLAKEPLESSHFFEILLRQLKYETAIAAGPDTLSSVKYYNEMIQEINSINLIKPDDTYIIYEILARKDDEISSLSFINQFVESCCRLYSPRQLLYAGAWFQWHIQHQKLLRLASEGKKFLEIDKDLELMREKGNIPLIYKNTSENIQIYFWYRTKFDTYKLCLALKIYKAKHGKFPDSLSQLVPSILPKIPCDLWNGKDYVYKPDNGGFILAGSRSDYYYIKYQYRPWNVKAENTK
jgi:hypothetical protein